MSFLLLLSLSAICNGILLPQPSGPFQVSVESSQLIDKTRLDPWHLDTIPNRRVMISRWDPVKPNKCHNQTVPYFSPLVAATEDNILGPYGWPTGVLGQFELGICSQKKSGHHKEAPLVIFSPGLNTTRFFYSLYAQAVASRGFSVVTIDHPFETDVVEFPDGTVAYGGNTNTSDLDAVNFALDVRVDDISFLLDTLGVSHDSKSPKAVMFGDSFGGATTAGIMMNDTRIKGGVNLDGSLFGPVIKAGFTHPEAKQKFVLFGADLHTTIDADWESFWGALGREEVWKRELVLKNGTHPSFWDLPWLADVSGVRDGVPDYTKDGLLGYLPGAKITNVVADYLRDFFNYAIDEKRGEGLLSGPSPKYPEIGFL